MIRAFLLTSTKFTLFSLLCSSFVFAFIKTPERDQIQRQARSGQRTLTYTEARKVLFGQIYLQRDNSGYFVEDVYCDMKVRNGVGPGRIPNHSVINVEHSWPQSRFSSRYGKTVQKTDLHHLFPTNSRANSRRANHIFAEVVGSSPTDNCDISAIGSVERTTAFMPPENIRGDIARALFYFAVRYDKDISEVEEFYLRQWHYLDPVDDFERARHQAIVDEQGNVNPFVLNPDLITDIENF